jgi:ankyrin repeat protein
MTDADIPVARKIWKPLMDAALAGDAPSVRSLLKAGADPNMLSNSTYRHRPLHRAIEHKKTIPRTKGHEQVVRLLLAAGADPRARALVSGVTAFALAAQQEPRFLPLLLPEMGTLDLYEACAILDEKRLSVLLKKDPKAGKRVDPSGWSPLHHLAASGSFTISPVHSVRQRRMAKALIAAGNDPSATYLLEGKWPISVLYHAAGQHDNPALVELLLEAGANPMDNEGIWHASDEGHEGVLAVFERLVPADILAQEATRCLEGQLRFRRKRGAPWLIAHGADPALMPHR